MENNGEIEECVQDYFKSLKGIKTLSKDEEHVLLKDYRDNNNIVARNKLILSNLKYASKLASSFRGRGLTYYELISEANNGLIEAIEKFDLNNDVKLISYAKWWIMQRMQSAIEKRKKMPYSDLPTDNETQLSEDSDGISYKESNNLYNKFMDEDVVEEDDDNTFIKEIFTCLSDRETDMINMYYGRNYDKQYTLEEIGKKYGLTKERVRQIIEKSFTKIRSEAILIDNKYLSR